MHDWHCIGTIMKLCMVMNEVVFKDKHKCESNFVEQYIWMLQHVSKKDFWIIALCLEIYS